MPQLKPTRGIRLNRSHPFSRGLVGFWLFNEGSGNTVFDLSGNNSTGTFAAANPPRWQADYINFDSGVERILVPHKSVIDFSAEAFSIVMGFRTTSADNQYVINKNYGGSSVPWYLLGIYLGKPNFIVDDGTTIAAVDADNTFNDGEWHISAGVRNVSTGKIEIYVDGILAATPLTDNTGSVSNTGDLYIGCRADLNAGRDFTGDLKFVYIYNRVLLSGEVALLHREPFCMFGRVNRPELIGGQIVNLAGSSVALSSLSATTKVMRKVGGNVVGTSDVAALLNSIRSLLKVERDWLREALFNGMTANAFKLGTTLSLGWFWVRVAGCSVLYRGFSMGEIDFVNILAVAEQDACEISPPSYISHNSSSTYFYIVRRFNNCGYQERTLAASVKVSIEPNGELAKPQPNKVFDSGAELVDGNKILLVWYYCPLEQKSQPMCFNVYYDGRTGQINYENPLAIIGYKGRKFYSYQCGALEAGRYLFAIRTEDVSGIENSSLARLRIQFDPKNPDAIDILSAEGV